MGKRGALLFIAGLAALMLVTAGMAQLADPRPRSERHRDAIQFLIASGVILTNHGVTVVDKTFCGGALTGLYVNGYSGRPGSGIVEGRLCWDSSAKRWFARGLPPTTP